MRGLLNEVLWMSGRSTGESTTRQEGMMSMQALLGKLPKEAKKKLTRAEVSTHGQSTPMQVVNIEGPWYGRRLQATVRFSFTAPEKLEVGVEFGSDLKNFSGKPGEFRQLGTEAGTWLRKVLLAAKKSKKKPRYESTEKVMLDKLLHEMREQAGLEEARYSAQHGKTPKGNWGWATKAVTMAQGQYESLQDYIGRIKKLGKEVAHMGPERVSGNYHSAANKQLEPVHENLKLANKHALEAVRALVKFKAWLKANPK